MIEKTQFVLILKGVAKQYEFVNKSKDTIEFLQLLKKRAESIESEEIAISHDPYLCEIDIFSPIPTQ